MAELLLMLFEFPRELLDVNIQLVWSLSCQPRFSQCCVSNILCQILNWKLSSVPSLISAVISYWN